MLDSRFCRACGLLSLAMGIAAGSAEPSAAQAVASSGPANGLQSNSAQLHLRSLQSVTTRYQGSELPGSARPLAMAAGDFDEDGVPDLVSGYATSDGGAITIHRGNVAALWPYGAALRSGPPAPFLPTASSFSVPQAPNFLETGDFDADGHRDVVFAQRGGDALYFLLGDGHRGFRKTVRIPLAGRVTAMIVGEVNRADGLADVAVTVDSTDGPRVLVFESPRGAMLAEPEVFSLPASGTALALGRFGGGAMNDLVVAAGNQLLVIHARDRKLAVSGGQSASVAPARVTMQSFGFAIQALASGDFTGHGLSVAALGNDGRVHILEHQIAPGATAETTSGVASIQVRGPGGKAVVLSGPSRANPAAMAAAGLDANGAEWTERSAVSLPSGFNQASPRLVTGHVTGSMQEEILVADSGNAKIHVLSTGASGASRAPAIATGETAPAPAAMSLLASLDAADAPVAILPMRLSQHGLSGLVVLRAHDVQPNVAPQDVPPANVFTVTNTLDITAPGAPVPAGSLRQALISANAATGSSSIVFNIPTTDPNWNPATGVFLIRPIVQPVPTNPQAFYGLPTLESTITLDGYTQPGASPNTLANGDNAKVLIQIDGSLITVPGVIAIGLYDEVGSTVRGLVLTGFNFTGGQATVNGARGIDDDGVDDFLEGNFIGTDATGKIANPNNGGIFLENEIQHTATQGTVVGGTTPQARNIISGNSNSGVSIVYTAVNPQIEGNYIGVDSSGALGLGNGDAGVSFNGATVTVGGTLAGAGNVISGNANNVDINDLLDQGESSNDLVQGNLIGTDATGTHAITLTSTGVSILHNPQYMTIGGTTPAARNVISGNQTGVYIFDNSFYNTVQGNYIGTDITGTNAVFNDIGFNSGSTVSTETPAGINTLGGAVPGAGNVISGNASDGVRIAGTSEGPRGNLFTYQGNVIEGNFIGTDPTGAISIPNGGNGIYLETAATNNIIGGTGPGVGNVISNNGGHGVLIDPGTPSGGQNVGNNTVGNTIVSNGGAGVRVNSGANNLISKNSIFGNKALGIDIGAAGPNLNTHCNATNTGANNLQNAPVLTAGTGAAFISATATDPNGNTSEFSNAVPESISGNMVSLLGNFDSVANTAYTIEFFSSSAADASGFGQGQTYLGSTLVTTGANCTMTVNDPVNLTQADMSVAETNSNVQTGYGFTVGPDFGLNVYTDTVSNNGPATAHNVIFTDTLPASLEVSSAYCDIGSCQSPIITTLGNCSVSGNAITCNLGTMPAGSTATITIPVQTLAAGSITNVVNVSATEGDPNLANNTSSVTATATNPTPSILSMTPVSALVNSPDVALTIYGTGLLPTSMVTFNGSSQTSTLTGSPLTVTGFVDNQVCQINGVASYCAALQATIPAAMLTTAGSPIVEVGNNSTGFDYKTFTIASSCTYSVLSSLPVLPSTVENSGTPLNEYDINVDPNVPTCAWTASSSVPWAAILDNASATGNANVAVAISPNTGTTSRTGSVTVAGQTFTFQQDPGATCSYVLDSMSATFSPAGGSGTIGVTSTDSSCVAFGVSYAPWITIPQASSSVIGNGTLPYTVAPSAGLPRTGSIMVGGNAYTVTQTGASCYFTLSANSALLPAGGGTGSIGVTASSSRCPWTATASSGSTVSITSGATGTGNGTVNYTVPVNAAGPQTATITIGNQTVSTVYTIQQASAFACTFTLSPSSFDVSSSGGANVFTITPSYKVCQWTAASNNPSALSITGNSAGTGALTIHYAVSQNSGAPRTLTITAGCETFTVNQDGNVGPAITTLQPSTAAAGSSAFTLTVNGSNFVTGAVVNFNGMARSTTFVSATQLTAAILASDVATAGTPGVTVTNPSGGTSNAVTFTVTATSNSTPTITTLQPSSAAAGSGAFTLTVNGSGFVNGAVVNFNGSARVTTYVSATQVTAAILASDVASAGTAGVTVTNPSPGGGTSASATFTITAANNPAPALASLQPSTTAAGSPAFTLTVNGSGFVSSSVVNFNGTPRPTTYVSATQLSAAILATDVANAGSASITVTSPSPGGGTSGALTFTITVANNSTPAITSLQPATATAGSPAFTLTVNGSSFVNGAVVYFNGNARTTTFVGATQLTATILASDIAVAATPSVTVKNPAPGGGTSNALTFTVTAPNNPAPTITSLQPSHSAAGAGFTLTVNGNSFLASSIVAFNGKPEPTTFVSASQLTAAIPAGDASAGGVVAVTVTNPAPGGGSSPSSSFSLDDYSISAPPGAVTVIRGGAPVQVTITVVPGANGFANPIQLSVSGLASGLTGVFSQPTLTPGSSSATSVLTITATVQADLKPIVPQSRFRSAPGILFAVFCPFGLWIARRRFRASSLAAWASRFLLLFVLAGLGALLSGCGGGFLVSTTLPDAVTVTAASGTDQHTTQITVAVVTQ
jgi:uncharacterized repeat protein (TIGR01451 family)